MHNESDTASLDRRTFLQTAAVGIAGSATLLTGEDTVRASSSGPTGTTAPLMPRAFAYQYDQHPYPLDPGPHLFIDWRYVQAGRVGYLRGDGQEAPLFAHEELAGFYAEPMQVPYGIRLEAQPAQKLGPTIECDREWEFIVSGGCMHSIDGKFRIWYEVHPPRGEGEANLLCYAESDNGIDWVKPFLGLVEYRGSRNNNIVIAGRTCPYGSFHGSSVFIDPSAPPEARYKVIYMALTDDDALVQRLMAERPTLVSRYGQLCKSVICYGESPDGFNWKLHDDILMAHESDTQTTVYYDKVLQRYVGYFRTKLMKRRAIGRAESDDLRHWSLPETVLWPRPDDDPSDDYYLNSKSIYPGTRTMHLMFPTIYKRRVDGSILRMAGSLDGLTWRWLPGDDVLSCGSPGAWDAGWIGGGFGLTEIPGGRVVLPFSGFRHPHKYPRWGRLGGGGLAVWKRERLSAICADEEGEFWTPPLQLPGQRLYLNFETSQAGYVRVEVDEAAGRSLGDCDVLVGDDLKRQVTWNGSAALGSAEGAPAVLRFRLRAAKLFSFEVK